MVVIKWGHRLPELAQQENVLYKMLHGDGGPLNTVNISNMAVSCYAENKLRAQYIFRQKKGLRFKLNDER